MEASFNLTVTNGKDYDALLTFLKTTRIKSTLVRETHSYNSGLELIDDVYTFNQDPNPEFKSFCGHENLNGRGHISLEAAYKIVLDYAMANNLYLISYIELNDVLSKALRSTQSTILTTDIPSTLYNLFTRV
jgi:hypothetical protein